MSRKHRQTCSIASFLNIFGDAWTLLVIREAFYGATRFGEFQQNTGIARNILSDRLAMLVEQDVLARVDIGERGTRYEYHLTEHGLSLMPVIVAISQWANDEVYGAGREPVELYERASGKKLLKMLPRDRDGKPLRARDIVARAGPGASRAARERIAAIPADAGALR